MTLAVWVERNGRLRPDDPALADGERVHASWNAFAAHTAGAAAGLRDDLGLSPGDRVAIVMRNRPEYLEADLRDDRPGTGRAARQLQRHGPPLGQALDGSHESIHDVALYSGQC